MADERIQRRGTIGSGSEMRHDGDVGIYFIAGGGSSKSFSLYCYSSCFIVVIHILFVLDHLDFTSSHAFSST
jgi:hypothetical protein